MPLTPELVSALRAIEHQGEFVFVNEDGTRLRPGQFHELLWGAQRRAGLRRIPWHGLAENAATEPYDFACSTDGRETRAIRASCSTVD